MSGLTSSQRGRHSRVAKLCLDWTERRHHLSWPLATAILHTSLERGWLERRAGSRALTITPDGLDALERWFGIGRMVLDSDTL